jgi:hypothetical protein
MDSSDTTFSTGEGSLVDIDYFNKDSIYLRQPIIS